MHQPDEQTIMNRFWKDLAVYHAHEGGWIQSMMSSISAHARSTVWQKNEKPPYIRDDNIIQKSTNDFKHAVMIELSEGECEWVAN